MARLTFGRTVTTTICDVDYIDQNNDKQHAIVELFGDYDMISATTPCKKALNAKGCIVTDVKHKSFYGKMSIEQFAELCEKSNEQEW